MVATQLKIRGTVVAIIKKKEYLSRGILKGRHRKKGLKFNQEALEILITCFKPTSDTRQYTHPSSHSLGSPAVASNWMTIKNPLAVVLQSPEVHQCFLKVQHLS
jgi:hypothetical protein